jgi:ABC-type transport system involved in multi-copper enzyme maturation permease subunit
VQYFNEVIRELMKRAGRAQGDDDSALQELKFDLDKLPALEFLEANLRESWNSVWFDFLVLFLLVTCFFMISYVGFVRSDIR